MAGRFLVIAGLAVIALLGGLWVMMNDGDATVAKDVEPAPAAEVVETTPKTPDAVHVQKRSSRIPPVAIKRPTSQTPPAPGTNSPAPTLAAEDSAAKPPTITEALKEQVLLTESQVLECNDKAAKAGKKLEGEAAFGYTIARKNGKITIESTGVEYTAFDQATSDCFRETAHAMTFDSLPDGVEAITAYRKVVFHDGALKRQWMTEFAVTRPPPPPPKP